MQQLILTSAATHQFCSTELDQLLESYRSRCEEQELTGLVVYQDRRFLQVIEGEDEPVREMFARIRLDARQVGAKVLTMRTISEQSFPGQSLGLIDADRFPLAEFLAASDEDARCRTLAAICQTADSAGWLVDELARSDSWREFAESDCKLKTSTSA